MIRWMACEHGAGWYGGELGGRIVARIGWLGPKDNDGSNVSDKYKLSKYAMRPAACGEAIEVPESVNVVVSEPMYVERMFKPSANTSTHTP
jgi:hypothetical protein